MNLPALVVLLHALLHIQYVRAGWAVVPDADRFPGLGTVPDNGPLKPPDYMVDNTNNLFHVAPDKGTQDGPDWGEFGSLENYLASIQHGNVSYDKIPQYENGTIEPRQGSEFWLTQLGPLGKAPIVEGNYKFWRNVKDYGAKGDGLTDDAKAINAAISDGKRCGKECGNTFAMGAIIYFPRGTYRICRPIIQLYYTQFVGDPHNRPVIKGCETFEGIGLIDTDVYIPDGNGAQWYINQNQFFRHIRNFEFDLTAMPLKTDDSGQALSPTGIHWQVAQATTLQNLRFKMPTGEGVTHVGIFTENGSGGFVSDLEFEGGNIGWRVGSQQYTTRNLKFNGCTTAVQMIWDWGFNWQQIEVSGGAIAFNITGKGGDATHAAQGVGSVSIIDSKLTNVPIGILTSTRTGDPPNIVLDNLEVANVGIIVKAHEGSTLLAGGSTVVPLWAAGRRYKAGKGSYEVGPVKDTPPKPSGLLSGGKLFVRSRPQYENVGVGGFLVATQAPYAMSNDGTGDQTATLNKFLKDALAAGKIAYFPAGIYQISGTVTIPTGSRLQGSSWSQIMATGSYFSDMKNPKVAVRVGEKGDVGTMEIVEMMFTVKGPTAGAIMMEWNVRADRQGSAAMWDSHIRVGGAKGSDLDFASCPKLAALDPKCICSSLLLHVTGDASGYFENVWAWIADHDNDKSIYREPDSSKTQISLYGARGMLIESREPSWFYGTGSEHAVLYQYQLHKAKNVYMGHIQTEAPYFQPVPGAPEPFQPALGLFPGDPTFSECAKAPCKVAWGLRVIDSSDIYLHSVGLYSWFNSYKQYCVERENCQDKIMQIKGSPNIAMYNVFTKASVEIGSGGAGNTIFLNDSNKSGYTSEVSVWLPGPGDDAEVVYIGPEVYTGHTARCTPSCRIVLAPSPLPGSGNTTITIPPYTTSLEVGNSQGGTFAVTTTTITVFAPPVTTNEIAMSNTNISIGQTAFFAQPSVDIPPVHVTVTKPNGQTAIRTVTLPPWPRQSYGPSNGTSNGTVFPVSPVSKAGGDIDPGWSPPNSNRPPADVECPPDGIVTIRNLEATLTLDHCEGSFVFPGTCLPTTTVGMDAPSYVSLPLECTLFTGTLDSVVGAIPFPTDGAEPIITPVDEEEDEDDDEDEDSHYLPCDAWFFNLCIDWPELTITGWRLKLKPGKYKTGPPPFRLPVPGIEFESFPPWPEITIPPKGPVITPPKPANCETTTAKICHTTTSYGKLVSGSVTRTTTAKTEEECSTLFGCHVEDYETEVTTAAACTVAPPDRARRDLLSTPTQEAGIHPRQMPPDPNSPCRRWDGVIFPSDPSKVDAIRNWLDTNDSPQGFPWWDETTEVWSPRASFTAFFYIRDLTEDAFNHLNSERVMKDLGIAEVYFPTVKNRLMYIKELLPRKQGLKPFYPPPIKPQIHERDMPVFPSAPVGPEFYPLPRASENLTQLNKRVNVVVQQSYFWELSQISTPKGQNWERPAIREDNNEALVYKYYYDESAGEGQVVYVVDGEFDPMYPDRELADARAAGRVRMIEQQFQYKNNPIFQELDQVVYDHAAGVVSKLIGRNLGSAKQAEVVVPDVYGREAEPLGLTPAEADIAFAEQLLRESELGLWIEVLEDVLTPDSSGRNKVGRAIINFSGGIHPEFFAMTPVGLDMFRKILVRLSQEKVLIVTAAHNEYSEVVGLAENVPNPGRGNDITDIPAMWADPASAHYLPHILVVGATDINGRVGNFTPFKDWITYAPGSGVNIVNADGTMEGGDGSSFATPLVAGVAAYLRGLPSRWQEDLKDPIKLKALIKLLQRPVGHIIEHEGDEIPPGKISDRVPIVWNGQVFQTSCLLDDTLAVPAQCPDINQIYRPDAEKIPLAPGFGGAGAIVFETGAPSPTCTAHCGKLCTGFFCEPNPTGTPPDFHDPDDPRYKPQSTAPPLPTLTGLDPNCPKTTSTMCNGSGGRVFCQVQTVCAPPKPAATCDAECQNKKKLDAGNACNCNSGGCDDASPSCCWHSTCVPCDCNESSCAQGSPACCASGSCQWDRLEFTNHKDNWGICAINIQEWFWGNNLAENVNRQVSLDVESFMNDVKRQSATFDADFTETILWKKSSASMPDDIQIELAKSSGPLRKRATADVPAPGSIASNRWQSWDLIITTGKHKFSTGNRDKNRYPNCEVSDWDDVSFRELFDIEITEPNRKITCRWECGKA